MISDERFFSTFAGRNQKYPSPYFDVASTYMPTTIKSMFRWCRYYFTTNPVINAVIYKKAEYPVTDIRIVEQDQATKDKWTGIIRHQLKLKSFNVEVGLDRNAYGNAYVQVFFPFIKNLQCTNEGCRELTPVSKAEYKFVSFNFRYTCPKCGHGPQDADVVDLNVKDLKGIRLIRWNPEYITPEYNEVTGDTIYYLDLPQSIRSDLTVGRKHTLETLPHVYLQAVKEQKSLLLEKQNFMHLKRPTLAQKDMGHGMPMLMPVMKDAYYMQVLRKAQESIANAHIVPLKLLFPQASSTTSDPFSTYSLEKWRGHVEAEILKWRQDPNYMPILPVPIGHELVGGEGKALLLNQELAQVVDWIIAGLHTPREFVFGGLTYTGSNVSMRMLENSFISDREGLLDLDTFIIGRVADFMEITAPQIEFEKFKMADDLQRLGLIFNANAAQKVSDETFHEEMGLDFTQEEERKAREVSKQIEGQKKMQTAMAQIQGEVARITASYQTLATQGMLSQPPVAGPAQAEAPQDPISEMTSPLSAGAPNVELLSAARRYAHELEEMPVGERAQMLQRIALQAPELHRLIQQVLQASQGSQRDPMDPLQSPRSEVKPPRGMGAAA